MNNSVDVTKLLLEVYGITNVLHNSKLGLLMGNGNLNITQKKIILSRVKKIIVERNYTVVWL